VNSDWYDPARSELKPEAFKPWPRDTDGISFDRAKTDQNPSFRSVIESAQGPSANGYYVAVFRAGDLTAKGFRLVPDPDTENNNPGHALVTDIRFESRRDPECESKMILLAHGGVCLRVDGPFGRPTN
jgi:hypothetical protein